MANWEALNKEFFSVIDNMTDEEWESWHEGQEQNQIIRQAQKRLEMSLHLSKLKLSKNKGDYFQPLELTSDSSSQVVNIVRVDDNDVVIKSTTIQYAIAA